MKHIVYKTINLDNNKIYIGVHQTEIPEIFDGYLGNGLWTNDLYLLRNPKEPFHFAVAKHGIEKFKRETLKVFDNVNDAKRKWGSSAVGCLRGSFKTSKGFIFKYII